MVDVWLWTQPWGSCGLQDDTAMLAQACPTIRDNKVVKRKKGR